MSSDSRFSAILKQVQDNHTLDAEASAAAFASIMSGQVPEADLAAFLTALARRSPTVDEIIGAATAMRNAMTSFGAPPEAIDVCGTGGDGHGTFNVSTAAAFVVAACGVPVAKHGNRSISSRTGAADVLEQLGVRTDLPPATAERMLREMNFCFLFAPAYHPAVKHVAAVRRALGFRTIFNLLGPIANPARVRRQLMGVYAREMIVPIANVLKALGTEAAWVVHGDDGLDELTTTTSSHVAGLDGARISEFKVEPEDIGVRRATLADLQGGDAKDNAAAIVGLLAGAHGPFRDIVLLNSGAALVVAGKAENLRAGAGLAANSIDSGAARQALARVVAASKMAT